MKERRVTQGPRLVYQRRQERIQTRSGFQPSGWLKSHRRITILVVLIVAIILIWWRTFHISSIIVTGNQFLSTGTIKASVKVELDRHLSWQNLTMVDTDGLAAGLRGDQSLIDDIQIKRQWPNGLNIRIVERTPVLLWQTGDTTYWVDVDGIVVNQAAGTLTKLPLIVDRSNLPVKAGDRVVGTRFVAFIRDLVDQMPKQGLSIAGFAVPDTTTEVYVTTVKGFIVKFDTTRPSSEGLVALTQVMGQLTKDKKTPAEYIDLRVSGKAYYK